MKETYCKTKTAEIENKILDLDYSKCITTQEFNKLMVDNFAAKLVQVDSATKADIADSIKETDFDKKNFKKLLQIKQNIYWLKVD